MAISLAANGIQLKGVIYYVLINKKNLKIQAFNKLIFLNPRL